MLELVGVLQVVEEALAEGDVDVAHLALAAAVVAKVVVNANPFLVFGVQFGFEVGEEVHLQLGLVQEIVLAADDGEFSLGPDGFRPGLSFLCWRPCRSGIKACLRGIFPGVHSGRAFGCSGL